MPWSIAPTLLLASHASEMSHVFGDPYKPSSDDTTVSDAMNAFWAHFAQTGDPNYLGAAATRWCRTSAKRSAHSGSNITTRASRYDAKLSDWRPRIRIS